MNKRKRRKQLPAQVHGGSVVTVHLGLAIVDLWCRPRR